MGKDITFEKNGIKVSGYIAEPTTKAPAVIIIHEWWGLDSPLSNIKELTDKLAQEGFVAFAPDFYNGKNADNPDDAGKLMMDMFENRMEEVTAIFKASVDYLKECDKTSPKKVGVTGFCCGGTLSMYFADKANDIIDASVPFYGLPQLAPIDASNIKVPIFFILAEKDEFVKNDDVIDMAKSVWKNSVDVQLKVYSEVTHAFLNTKRPDVYNEEQAQDAWDLAVKFFKRYLS
ncbi:MAG: dienelactone hydrolase family protein [Aquificae bacterium]|nr:dienelactone hydrolase family protein [Aquificota bacterium]